MEPAADCSLHLVDDRGEVISSFSINSILLESFKGYLQACAQTAYRAQLQNNLASAMQAAVQQVLPYHLRQPSDAQISYAVGIARALGIPVPPEVLSQRWAIHDFLDRHVPEFKSKQGARHSVKDSGPLASTPEGDIAEPPAPEVLDENGDSPLRVQSVPYPR
jgi:hypothetical protein